MHTWRALCNDDASYDNDGHGQVSEQQMNADPTFVTHNACELCLWTSVCVKNHVTSVSTAASYEPLRQCHGTLPIGELLLISFFWLENPLAKEPFMIGNALCKASADR